ncbi:MAG: large conductance mechanosensitive channel protein MscL [Candidatus Nanopelagicales bacterium]
MLKGFKEFIMRGNVVDLAIAVVIGAAFSGIVTQLTKSFIEPLIKLVGGGGVSGGAFTVNGVPFDWAAFINACINFLIVAAVIYFLIVVPMNKIKERAARKAEPLIVSDPEDLVLLREIRDLLRSRQD